MRDADSLRDTALRHRPELAALAAKIQSEQAAVALACKEYYPDFEFMGRYDAFWTDNVQRPMVGMNMNIPLNQGRRGAAVREAQFKVTKLINEHSLAHRACLPIPAARPRAAATSTDLEEPPLGFHAES